MVDKSQVWVASLGKGPNKYSLNAAYRNASTLQFQDEVGEMVIEVCKKVQFGVLVFLPSYKMLNTLVERWQSNGMWKRLFDIKHIITEPRSVRLRAGAMEVQAGVQARHQLGTALVESFESLSPPTMETGLG